VTYLLTGATGNVGGACARFLLQAKCAGVRCLVRDPANEKAKALAELGAELVSGDFADAQSLRRALDGVDAALLACGNQPEQVALETAFIGAMAGSHKYLVKLSTCGAPGYCAADSPVEYGRWHAAIEASLTSTEGLHWTVLQPNCFMQNHLGDVFGSLPHKALAYPRSAEQLETGAAAIVDTRDVGEVAARLLLLPERSAHHGRKYHVCGPASWSVSALARLYESVLELPPSAIHCAADLTEADYASSLEKNAGFPRWLAAAVARSQTFFWAEGKLDYASADAVRALHPNFRSMEEWVREHAALVRFA